MTLTFACSLGPAQQDCLSGSGILILFSAELPAQRGLRCGSVVAIGAPIGELWEVSAKRCTAIHQYLLHKRNNPGIERMAHLQAIVVNINELQVTVYVQFVWVTKILIRKRS